MIFDIERKNKKMKKIIAFVMIIITILVFVACESTTTTGTRQDVINQQEAANKLQSNQATPTDIDYSLERYNLIRRAYWVNGQREKANTLPCEVEKPLGYIVLFTESGAIVGSFVVDGKVSSLNSFLTPDSEYYELIFSTGSSGGTRYNKWLSDVDGTYGTNDNGIFFFTPDGKYIEWTGIYLYSDIPFEVDDPIVKIGGTK
jgi:hypothetical protein